MITYSSDFRDKFNVSKTIASPEKRKKESSIIVGILHITMKLHSFARLLPEIVN